MKTKSIKQGDSTSRNNRKLAVWAGLILLLPIAAWAGGTVTNCTEVDFLAAAAGGGRVNFACDGTITLSQTFTNNLDTVLDATGHLITISGGNAVRVFCVNSNVTFSVINLAITSGRANSGAGILSRGGNIILSGASLEGNTAAFVAPYGDVAGGAILMKGGSLSATNCTFSHNTADRLGFSGAPVSVAAQGGAIRNDSGLLSLQNCQFLGNLALGEAGPWNERGMDGAGGAIHSSGTLTVDSCLFTLNTAQGGAGAIHSPPPGRPGFVGGTASGGAIYNLGALVLNRSLFNQNSATGGDGTEGAGGGLDGTTLTPGGPGADGGDAIGGGLCNYGTANLANCTFAANSAHGGTGGSGGYGGYWMHNGSNGGNGGRGGWANGGLANGGMLTNCTIANNTAVAGAGGSGGPGAGAIIGANGGNGADGGSASGGINGGTLINCVLGSNSASAGLGGAAGRGGLGAPPGLPGNPGSNGQAGGNAYGYPTDDGHNLSSDASCAFTNTGSMNNTDPLLAPLANNGGPTLTIALLTGSPAIDAGNTAAAPPTDQRGYMRPAGAAADVGAFESDAAPPPPAISPPALTIVQTGPTTLEVQGQWAIGTNQTCRLLSSVDMLGWSPIATNHFDVTGTVVFWLTFDPATAPRVYRLSVP